MTDRAHPTPDASAPIAIVGMACIFPQAPDLQAFWNNILGKVDAVGEPLPEWQADRYLAAGRIKTQYGGYLKDLYRFDPREFGIMPNSIDGGEPDHYLALRVARDALADAGHLGPDEDHTDTGVILGHSTYLHRGQVTVIQNNIVLDQTMDLVKLAMPHLDEAALAEVRRTLQAKLPPHNADTAPGLVPNVMTGRIANRLNLKGPNYLVDAACSSSLLAVAAAMDELRAGRSRMMIAGGVNASLPADVTTIFTQLGALSTRGKVRPFEDGSDGTLLGEGLGAVVLKRLDDALADGDRVYAVLRGVGQASDGRGTGLLAPSVDGEALAVRRAYDASGIDPASIGLVEAHGTGIPLGDKTEIASLKAVFGGRDTPAGTKAIGSVKSMISHCIPAAGIASLIKMALSLHHRVLPPTLCESVNPALGIDDSPFYVNTETAPWMARPGALRRAAVNSFGFGGINTHAIVEQAPPEARRPPRLTAWAAELCVLSADSVPALAAQVDTLATALEQDPGWTLAEVAAALAGQAGQGAHRLAIVAKDIPGLLKNLAQARKRFAGESTGPWTTRGGLSYGNQRESGQLAFIFPGEGSQYPAMFADLAPCFDVMQGWLDFWHGLYDLPTGHTRTDIVFPSCEISPERRREFEQRLHDMDVGSEAVFIGGMAMHELMVSLGVQPDVMLGHSSGESAALGASGANPATSAADRAACISRHFAVYDELLKAGKIPTGALLAVGALPPETVQEVLAEHGDDVVVAMDNCGNQIVLYGAPSDIQRVQDALTAKGGICMPLPFDRGYHTPAFADVSAAFLQYYKDVKLGPPKLPLYSCASVGLFPDRTAAVRKLAAAQWSQTVRFRETVLKMHDDGVRSFVEIGPSANLTAFVNDILIDREFTALATNQRRKSGLEQLLGTLGQLWIAGRWQALDRLFEGRAIAAVDLTARKPAPRGQLVANTLPVLDLGDEDRATLRRLMAPPAAPVAASGALPPASGPGAMPASATAPAGPAEEVEADPRVPVMQGYFGLMRDFLATQEAVAQNLPYGASSEPGDASPAQTVGVEPAAHDDFPAVPHVKPGPTPLIDRIVEHGPDRLVAFSDVCLETDRFVRDHVLSGPVTASDPALFGLSCVPFTVSLELMAEACALLAGRTDVRVIENVRAFDWVALDEGAVSIEVQAEALDAARGHYVARVATPRGPALSAEFRFEAEHLLQPLPALVSPRESCLNEPNLYATGMFHGPVFQTLQHVQAWDDTGIDVEVSRSSLAHFFADGHVPELVLNPVLLDAMGQIVACWLVQYVGVEFHSFPSTIGRLELIEPCPADRAGIVMRGRQRPVDGQSTDIRAPRAWQIDCVDGEGRPLLRGSEFVNLFFQVPRAYHDIRHWPHSGWLGRPAAWSPDPDVLLWQLPMLSEEFCAQSGAITLRVMAHALLAAEERPDWQALGGSLRRRREWLFGRAAIKEAVRHWIHAQTGELPFATDVVVRHDEHGAPWVDGWWRQHLTEAPEVSLSHVGEHCLAAVSWPGAPVGVDLELLGRIRQPELLIDTLSAAEQQLVQGLQGETLQTRLLRLWCAREAAAKCLGTGLQGQPEAFGITAADENCEQLVVTHTVGACEVVVHQDGEQIMAVAMPAMSATEVEE